MPICHIIGARSHGCPITGVQFELFVIGYPHDLHVNYARFNGFSLKRTSQKTFLVPKFVIDIRLISNWTSCPTIQGVIVLVISNQPRALRSSDFEITCVITRWIVLHSVQFLLLTLLPHIHSNHPVVVTKSLQLISPGIPKLQKNRYNAPYTLPTSRVVSKCIPRHMAKWHKNTPQGTHEGTAWVVCQDRL